MTTEASDEVNGSLASRSVGPATADAVQAVEASVFKLRAQMLEQGRTDQVVAKTSNMIARLKVYASGGENALHAHPNEDHMFLILQGNARFFDADDKPVDLLENGGIMLPAGAYYRFEATSEEPLVLLRIGCRVGAESSAGRLGIDGKPLYGNSKENKTVPVIYREGEFFE